MYGGYKTKRRLITLAPLSGLIGQYSKMLSQRIYKVGKISGREARNRFFVLVRYFKTSIRFEMSLVLFVSKTQFGSDIRPIHCGANKIALFYFCNNFLNSQTTLGLYFHNFRQHNDTEVNLQQNCNEISHRS